MNRGASRKQIPISGCHASLGDGTSKGNLAHHILIVISVHWRPFAVEVSYPLISVAPVSLHFCKRVGSEWRLVKAQNFLGETLAPPGIGRGDEDDSAGNALHLLDDLP